MRQLRLLLLVLVSLPLFAQVKLQGGSAAGGNSGGGGPTVALVFLSNTTIACSNTPQGESSNCLQGIYQNTGGQSLSGITFSAVTGPNAADFVVTTTPATNCGGSLSSRAVCSISTVFTPSIVGTETASFTITDSATGSPRTVQLFGIGVQPVCTPGSTVSPSALSFPAQPQGTTSATQQITYSSTGSGPCDLAFSAPVLGGTHAGDFAISTTCISPLAGGNNCAVLVTCTPTVSVGVRSATVTFTDNSNNSPKTVNLSCQASSQPQPSVNLSPPVSNRWVQLVTSSALLGAGALGPETSLADLSLYNENGISIGHNLWAATADSTDASTVASNAIDLNANTFWSTSTVSPIPAQPHNLKVDTSSTKLMIGASLTVRQDGCDNGWPKDFVLNHSPDGSTWTVGASGTVDYSGEALNCPGATQPLPRFIPFLPGALAFGSPQTPVDLGTTSAAQSATITNTGNATLTLTLPFTTSGDFLVNSSTCGVSLAIGASCTVDVVFSPSIGGLRVGALTVRDNAASSASQVVPLSGYGRIASTNPPTAFVQGNSFSQSATGTVNMSLAYNSNVTAGNMLLACFGWASSAAMATPEVTDSRGNTYLVTNNRSFTSGTTTVQQGCFYTITTTGGADTVTVHWATGPAAPDIRISEYAGVQATNSRDGGFTSGGIGTAISGGAFTTTGANELITGAAYSTTGIASPGSGWTQRLLSNPLANLFEDQAGTAIGTYTTTGTAKTSSAIWIASTSAFRPATPSSNVNKYYVSSATGSDANDGLAASVGGGHGPWATLTKAASAFALGSGGTEIHVADGNYNSNLDITRGGTASARVIWQCDNGIASGLAAKGHCKISVSNIAVITEAPYLRITGFDIGNNPNMTAALDDICPSTGGTGQNCTTGGNNQFWGNYLHDLGSAVFANGFTGCIDAGAINQIAHGYRMNHDYSGNFILNIASGYPSANTNGGNCAWAIDLSSYGGKVWNNIMINLPTGGIGTHAACGLDWANNVVIKSTLGYVPNSQDLTSCPGGTAGNNTFANNYSANVEKHFAQSTGNVDCTSTKPALFSHNITDGLGSDFSLTSASCNSFSPTSTVHQTGGNFFVNYLTSGLGDYHLKTGSLGIDAGDTACVSGGVTPCVPATDFEGNSRPRGVAYDVGAYESVSALPATGISARAFGMHWNSGQTPYSTYSWTVSPAMRLWDSQTKWGDIETSAGVYDWTHLDNRVNDAVSAGADIVYTLGGTPDFYSTHGSRCIAAGNPDSTCTGAADANCGHYPGSCWAPFDIATGDTKFKNFMTALINHVGVGKIKYFECWNEPSGKNFWADTIGNLKTICTDYYNKVKQLDPNAKVLMPPSFHQTSAINLQGLISNGFGAISDINTFHGKHCPAEAVVSEISTIKADYSAAGLGNRELWNSEGGWKQNANCPTEDQPATLARLYILDLAQGLKRYYWYAFDNGLFGTLEVGGVPNASATAYTEVSKWLVGANFTSSCSANGTIWTCALTAFNGTSEQITWDTAKTCVGGCTFTSVTVPVQFSKYRKIDGTSVSITTPGHTVNVGSEPILLIPASLTANNTSADDSFAGLASNPANPGVQTTQPAPAPKNTSKLDAHTLLYSGATTKLIAHIQDWWCKAGDTSCSSGHVDIGYSSNNANQVNKQANDMISRGFQIVLHDWYGPGKSLENNAVSAWQANLQGVTSPIDGSARCAAAQNCTLLNGIMIDQGVFSYAWTTPNGTAVPSVPRSITTTADENAILGILKDNLCYLNQNYFNNNSYWKDVGRPVVAFYFADEQGTRTGAAPSWADMWIQLNTFATALNTNCVNLAHGWAGGANGVGLFAFVDSGTGVLNWDSTGLAQMAILWIRTKGTWNAATDCTAQGGTGSQYCWDNVPIASWYTAARGSANAVGGGGIFPGFDDANASWGSNRVMARQCGKIWMQTWAKVAAAGYSSTSQLKYIGGITWNDYEEGTGIESGIDPCYSVATPGLAGSVLSWAATTSDATYAPVAAGVPSNTTVKNWQIYYCDTSENCTLAKDSIPLATLSQDLSLLNIPSGTWQMRVRLVGQPSIWNRLSPVRAWTH